MTTVTWSKVFYLLSAITFLIASLTPAISIFTLFPLGFAFFAAGKAAA